MKKSLRVYLLSVLCLPASVLGSDFGIWQDIFMEKAYLPWIVQYNQQALYNNRGKHLFYEHSDIGAWYVGICKWFQVGGFFRYGMVEPEPHKQWTGVYAPHLDARIRVEKNPLFFQYRIRFHYVTGSQIKEKWIMRNEFLMNFNTRVVEIYGSVEPYYNITTQQLVENHIIVGIGKQFGEHFNGKIYYRNTQEPHSTAGRVTHFLGYLFTLSF